MSEKNSAPKSILVIAGLDLSLINFRGSLIKAMCDAGMEVHAAAPRLTSNPMVMETLNKWGVICHDIYLQRAGINPASDLFGLLKLFQLIRVIRPDTLLGYTIKPVIYGTITAWLANVPNRFSLITGLGYAFTGESVGKRKFIQIMAKKLYGLALDKSKLVFFQNPDDQALFKQLNILKPSTRSFVVNGSGVNISEYEPAPLPTTPHFLLIARLLGDKGIREYAQAAKQIKNHHPEVNFNLVGWIDENPDAIQQQELDTWVQDGTLNYLGKLADVRPAIAACSVYVLPSYREGTPRTVLEAMAMGRPVITTDAPGCRETVVDNDNGFLVPVKSVEALVVAMKKLIDNPELIKKMGQRSREIAEEKYDVHKVNDSMLKAMGISESTNRYT